MPQRELGRSVESTGRPRLHALPGGEDHGPLNLLISERQVHVQLVVRRITVHQVVPNVINRDNVVSEVHAMKFNPVQR